MQAQRCSTPLGLKWWTFDEDDAAAYKELYQKRIREKYAERKEANATNPADR